MISIINLHAGGTGEYIGRPSILGNPYILGVDGTRADCIDKYETYFLDKIENDPKFRKEFERLVDLARAGKLSIACWCAPHRCHGDVIKKYIEQRLNEERMDKLFKKKNINKHMDKILESLRATYNALLENSNPKVLYHRSSKLFKEFVPTQKHAFGTESVFQPIFFKETIDDSKNMGNVGNYLYTVHAYLNKTFNPADMYDWDKSGGVRDDINAFTNLGKLVYKTYLRYNPNKYDDDKFNKLMYIRTGAYDAIEDSNFLKWLQKNGFDSFYVSENGRLYEDKSVGVFVAQGKLEIVKVEEI